MEAIYQTRGDLVVLCGHSITDTFWHIHYAFQDPTPAVSALSGCVLFLAAVKYCSVRHDAIISINS